METKPLSNETIHLLYKEGNETTKKILLDQYGKDFFEPSKKWMELWQSFCTSNNLTVVLPFSEPKNSDEESANAYVMLIHIARIKNSGWVPDWDNSSQWKYYPWFDMRSGSGFSSYVCGNDHSYSSLGSRLCYQSSSLAESVGKEFLSIYEKFLTK